MNGGVKDFFTSFIRGLILWIISGWLLLFLSQFRDYTGKAQIYSVQWRVARFDDTDLSYLLCVQEQVGIENPKVLRICSLFHQKKKKKKDPNWFSLNAVPLLIVYLNSSWFLISPKITVFLVFKSAASRWIVWKWIRRLIHLLIATGLFNLLSFVCNESHIHRSKCEDDLSHFIAQ